MKLMKPEFYTEKEIDFYEFFLKTKPTFPMVQCYGTGKSPETKQGYVLLEDLRHTHHQTLWQLSPTQKECSDAVTVLANLHAYWWNHSRFGEPNFEIPSKEGLQNNAQEFEKWYSQFADFMGDRLSGKRKEIYNTAFEKFPDLLWPRLSSPNRRTLVHGDAFSWNFLHPNNEEENQCVIFDWRYWEIGLGARDLAYMMALHWYPERRQRLEQSLLKVYLEELQKNQINYTWEDLQTDYRISVISNLAIPVVQYQDGLPTIIWWDHLERAFAAFEDLDCMELL